MKIETPSSILKSVCNGAFPDLSTWDLQCLQGNSSPLSMSFNSDSETGFISTPNPLSSVVTSGQNHNLTPRNQTSVNISPMFKVPLTPVPKIKMERDPGQACVATPRPNARRRPKTPKSFFAQTQRRSVQRSGFLSPTLMPSTPRMQTPSPNVPLTPYLFNLCSGSPCLNNFSLDLLSTPALFPSAPALGVPDLLSIIDDEHETTQSISRRIDTFDTRSLCDENVTDFILDVTEDYTKIQSPVKKPKTTVTDSMSTTQVFRKGRRGKRLTKELEDILKEERRMKAREARIEKKKKAASQQKKSKGSSKEKEVDELQRKVKRCGRRTRSLVQACKEMGLASTDADVDAIFERKSSHQQDLSQPEE